MKMYNQSEIEVLRRTPYTLYVVILFTMLIASCAGTKKYEQVNSTSQATNSIFEESQEELTEPLIDKSGELSLFREKNEQQIFRDYGVNPTISTLTENISTFAMDVDTVSYRIAQESLERHQLPNKASIRVEEFVNNFDYNYRSSDDDFSLSAEVVPSAYRPGFHVLHVGIKAKDIQSSERLPANLVLVADVSGSMKGLNKMELQKQAFITLVSQLRADDKVAIVAYSENARVMLKPTTAKNKSKIYRAIKKLTANGGTNAAAGIYKGYQVADKMAYPGYINRVILTSDGLANMGSVEPQQILEKVKQYRQRNIFLTTVGVGSQMYNDYLLEQLANQGNGNYLYFSNTQDVQTAFVDGLTTQLQTVAKDAKVQITFNSETVSHYRQLGYENRGLDTQDFLDASKDGGELGANHQVTVLYEIKLNENVDSKEIANLSVSYKRPQGSAVRVINKAIPQSVVKRSNESISPDTIVAIASAAFAEKLRQSYWSRLYRYDDVQAQLQTIPRAKQRHLKIDQLKRLIARASQLDRRVDPYQAQYPLKEISYEQVPLLK